MQLNNENILKYNLSYLLHPFKTEDFYNDYYGRNFLHIPGEDTKLENLISYEDINEILQKFKLDVPNIRIVKDGQPVPRSAIMEEGLQSFYVTEKMPFLNNNAVASLLQSGYVMAIDDINQFINNLYLLRIALEWDMRERNKMNCYLGKEMSKGFGVHWDNHDVIVLQIYGEKIWNMYGFTDEYPLRPYNGQNNGPTEPLAQIRMTPGDVLYFPRGYWHATQAEKDFSLHITIGITRKTSLDYVDWLNTQLIKDSFFRKFLPHPNDGGSIEAYSKAMQQNLSAAINQYPPDAFMADVEASYPPPMLSSLPYSIDTTFFTPDTLIRLNTFRPLALIADTDTANFSFTCHKKKWSFNIILWELFQLLNKGEFITLNHIWDRLEDKIDKNTLGSLLPQLIQKGLLMVCDIR
jgi:ribosomal protein L16 Arg81 hydroxylase